jgi:hypothetical protein
MAESPSKRARTEEPDDETTEQQQLILGRDTTHAILEAVYGRDWEYTAGLSGAEMFGLDLSSAVSVKAVKAAVAAHKESSRVAWEAAEARRAAAHETKRVAVEKTIKYVLPDVLDVELRRGNVVKYEPNIGEVNVHVAFSVALLMAAPGSEHRKHHLSLDSVVMVGLSKTAEKEFAVERTDARSDLVEHGVVSEYATVRLILQRICIALGVTSETLVEHLVPDHASMPPP